MINDKLFIMVNLSVFLFIKGEMGVIWNFFGFFYFIIINGEF